MSGLTVLLFGVCALLLLMACVSADRVRALRESWNPSAPDVPDAAFMVARVVLVAAALGGVVVGFQGLAVEDRMEWSADELTSAVEGATRALDGSSAYGDPVVVDESADFDAYASTIEQEVGEHGGGDAPQFGVNAELVGPRSPAGPTTRSRPEGPERPSAWRSSVRGWDTSRRRLPGFAVTPRR